MNSFRSSYNTMKPAYLLVFVTLMLLPWVVLHNALPMLSLLAIAVILMIAKGSKGATFVIMAIALCIPHVSYKDSLTSLAFSTHFAWLNRTIYLCLLASALILLFNNNGRKLNKTIKNLYLIVSIAWILASLRFGVNEAVSCLWSFLVIPVFFWICQKDKVTWSDFYYMFTVIFLCVSFYALLEFLFQINPYSSVLSRVSMFDDSLFAIRRACGILGNPLLMTGFAMSYHTILLVNYQRTGQISIPLLLLSMIVLFATGSRTAVYTVFIVWLIFIVYIGRVGRVKTNPVLVMLIAGVMLYCVAEMAFPDYLDFFFSRFGEGSEHREAGLQTALNIWGANPWGVGRAGTEDAFLNFAADGFVTGMQTVDNAYLTFFITDGYLFFIPLLFYFFIPFYTLRLSFKNKQYKVAFVLLVPYLVCGLSFNINSFMQLNILYFGIAGHIYQIINKENLNGSLNHIGKL